MSRRSDQTRPVAFEPLRRNLEHWRQSRVPGRPMPDHLWKAAARLAREHGVSKTAFALRLDYYRLKERLEASRREPRGSRGRDVPTFLEVPLGVPLGAPDCVLQVEDEGRGRLRIELRGRAASEIELLVRSLWSAAR